MVELAKLAAGAALKAGAEEARVKVNRSRRVQVEWRDGKLDRIRESTKQGLTIALYVDGRYSGNSTSDIRPEAVKDYVTKAVNATRYLAPDPHRHLPDPSRYEDMATGLQLRDAAVAEVSPKERLTIARRLEEAVREAPGKEKIISVTSSVSDHDRRTVCFNTNGLEAEEDGSFFVQYADVSVRDESDRKPSDYGYGQTRFFKDMCQAEALGAEALRRALGRCGSRQVATGDYDVVIENRTVPGLVRHLVAPLFGRALQQKTSFMEGRLGQQVVSKLLTITDDPHLPRGLSSTAWDGEGMATRKRTIFDQGVLKSYYLDTYYASKLGMEPTSGANTNFAWALGKRDGRTMLADLDKGLFVTGFLGGNSNSTTGDFSLGVRGFFVEKGRPVHAVSEMNVAGNHLEFWKRLVEVGNDPFAYGSNLAPSLRFEKVQFSGKG